LQCIYCGHPHVTLMILNYGAYSILNNTIADRKMFK
jgi:hypothetical protein